MPVSSILDAFGRTQASSYFYEAVRPGARERRWLPTVAADSRQTITSYSRTQALALSRYMVSNVGMIRGLIRDTGTYTVGSGMVPQSLVKRTAVGDQYEEYFQKVWAPQADVTGRHTFGQLQALANWSIEVDGDIGFAQANTNPLGQLQVIEGHRITSENANDERYVDGVLVDSIGRPQAYRVKEGDQTYRDVSARDFIFLYDPDRADQYRGITSLAHAIPHARDILDTISYEKVGMKMGSAIGVVIKTSGGVPDSGSSYIENGFKAADTGALAQETWQAGMIPRLRVGESIESLTSNRPSPAFMGFLEFLIRDIAVGMGLPFEFVWDLARAKGSGSRFILAKAQRRFDQRQALLVERFLNRIWFWVIGRAIKRGDLPSVPGWWKVRWQGPAKLTVDMGREAQANRDDLRFGNRTLQMDAAEQGLDWKINIREQINEEATDLLDRAVALVEKYKAQGLTLDKALFILRGDSPNAPQLPNPNDQGTKAQGNSNGE